MRDLGFRCFEVETWGYRSLAASRVWGLGFRVQGLGFRVQGLGFRVWG